MAKMYYDSDCNLELLKNKTVAIIGYGSQGHAHAQNLKESGVNVVVGLRANSERRKQASDDGLKVMDTAEAAKAADLIMILTPDEVMAGIYKESISQILRTATFLPLLTASTSIFNR